MTDRVGQVLAGRYRLSRLLGSGGMGSVFLAEHIHLGRPTAIKVLRRELGTDPEAEARFRREALLAAKINHPTVAQIYDFDRTPEGEFFLAMEYIAGETVGRRLRRDGPFPLPLAVRVLLAVADGLDRAHSLGVLHRDIKPENIMLGQDGLVKLVDFGVARAMDSSSGGVTSPGFAVGTPAYMSPEQLVGEPVGPASDLYSLGTVVYEMLTGREPHAGGSFDDFRAKRLMQAPPAVHTIRDSCAPGVSEVVARALAVEPKARWPTARAFADALAAVVADPTAGIFAPAAVPATDQLEHWEAHFEALRFAGRDREIRLVREAWATARAGRTTVLWIEGEEGSGKSSFFELAQREAGTDGARELIGRGYEGDVARPYGPWIVMLRTARDSWAPKDRPWPAISALTDADPATPTPERVALQDEVLALLQSAERGAVFVGLEDVDWCDPASIALVEYLVHAIAGRRVLFAVTAMAGATQGSPRAREMRERLRHLDDVSWVTLRPLGYEAVGEWLTRALGREAPEELVRYVYGNTEGNAFFIEQVMRTMVERHDLDRLSSDTVRLELAAAPPPEAVADVVERRLRGMSPAAREILQVAAVAGREFDVDLVLALSQRSEDALLEALDEAVAEGVLAPVQRVGGDWYRFTHSKLAHVLAQALNPRRRRKLHHQIAEALEQRGDSPVGTVAWHWYHAEEVARASVAARAAARSALALHDYDDALTFAIMAAETGEAAADKAEAHELRGDALRRLDRHGEAAAAYARARLGDVTPEAGMVLRRKELRSALVAGIVPPSAAMAEAQKLVAGAAALPVGKRAAAELVLAEALLAMGDHAGTVTAAERAYRSGLEAGDRALAADAQLAMGSAQMRAGNVAGAGEPAREAEATFLQLGDPYGAGRCGAAG